MSGQAGTVAPGILVDEMAQFTQDLIGDHRCELFRLDKGNMICGEPAAVRLPVSCWLCQSRNLVWICKHCHEHLWKPREGKLTCTACLDVSG